MTFKNLEDRFTKTSQDIYNRFPSPPGQYVQVKPDTASAYSRIKDDSRELPIVSTKRDLERVAKFLTSGNGKLFIGKQLLLQTGNTFAETRVYNPASPLVNTVPFTHSTRYINQSNISGLSGILGTGTSTMPSRGFLQKDTVNLFTTSPAASNLISRYLDRLLSPVNSILGAFGAQSTARPEDATYATQYRSFIRIPQLNINRGIKSQKPSTPDALGTNIAPNTDKSTKKLYSKLTDKDSLGAYYDQAQTDITGKRYFSDLENFNFGAGYFNKGPAIYGADDVGRNISDPYNLQKYPFVSHGNNYGVANTTPTFTGLYDGIFKQMEEQDMPTGPGIKSDIIKFIFTTTVGKVDKDVHFRAFLSSINQTVTPEFNEQRYIGRTERFVTYGGVKRSVSLKFQIAAFSQAETNTVWTKVNYLTGLAFPKGVSKSGFMIPPLFKITIGGIYDHQPCYINTLEFIMLDNSITFDIDAEVSQVIEVTMQLTLLEKTTKLYDSPFYRITEALPVDAAKTILQNIEASGQRMQGLTRPTINVRGSDDVGPDTGGIYAPNVSLNAVTPWKAVKGKIISDFSSDTSYVTKGQLLADQYNPTVPDSIRYSNQKNSFTDLQKAGLSTNPQTAIGLFSLSNVAYLVSDERTRINAVATINSRMTTNFSPPRDYQFSPMDDSNKYRSLDSSLGNSLNRFYVKPTPPGF
jgi:hypothetical protein